MQMLTLIWGILSLVGMFVGFIPCLGWVNYVNIPFAVVGLVIGIVTLAKAPITGRGAAVAGTIMSAAAIVLGFIRLMLGGGVI